MVGVLRETAQDDIVKVMVESAKAKKEEKSQDVRRVNRWHQASVHPTGLHETLFLRFIEEITSGLTKRSSKSKLLGVDCVELDVGRTHVHLGTKASFSGINLQNPMQA